MPRVRAHLIALQRGIIAAAAGIVAEGRDIGTVVAPDAQVKVFLTADGAARASRRAAEASWSATSTRADQDRRDRLDAAQSGKASAATATATSSPRTTRSRRFTMPISKSSPPIRPAAAPNPMTLC